METSVYQSGSRKHEETKRIIMEVYDCLKEKGYNPINQLVGYIMSEDPTYITTYRNARSMISKLDRDDILEALVTDFLK